MDLKFWTKKFWSDIGYWLGSGPILVRKVISLAQIDGVDTIVELGAGYGQVTWQLIARKSPHTRLIVIENDLLRVAELQRKYGTKCEIYDMSAAHITDIVDAGSVDVVVSTLPLGSISDEWVDHILRSAHASLRVGGRFVQYQYALQNISDVRRYFVVDHIRFELFNFWPAFVYQSHKK